MGSTPRPGSEEGDAGHVKHTPGEPAARRTVRWTAKEPTYPDTRSSAEQRTEHAPSPLRPRLALRGPGYLRR